MVRVCCQSKCKICQEQSHFLVRTLVYRLVSLANITKDDPCFNLSLLWVSDPGLSWVFEIHPWLLVGNTTSYPKWMSAFGKLNSSIRRPKRVNMKVTKHLICVFSATLKISIGTLSVNIVFTKCCTSLISITKRNCQ